MVEAIIDPIGNGPVGEDGSKAAPTGFEHIARTANVQKTFVLARKACSRKVFRRSGATHRDRNVGAIILFELLIRLRNLLSKPTGTRSVKDDRACFGSALRKHVYARFVDRVEEPMQPGPGSGLG